MYLALAFVNGIYRGRLLKAVVLFSALLGPTRVCGRPCLVGVCSLDSGFLVTFPFPHHFLPPLLPSSRFPGVKEVMWLHSLCAVAANSIWRGCESCIVHMKMNEHGCHNSRHYFSFLTTFRFPAFNHSRETAASREARCDSNSFFLLSKPLCPQLCLYFHMCSALQCEATWIKVQMEMPLTATFFFFFRKKCFKFSVTVS